MAHDSIVTLTNENFAAEVENAGVPVLVDFWAEWCGPCKALGPIIDQVAEEIGADAKIGKCDVAEPANQELAARFNVKGIPNLLLFKGGEVKEQIVGNVVTKDQLVSKLKALA